MPRSTRARTLTKVLAAAAAALALAAAPQGARAANPTTAINALFRKVVGAGGDEAAQAARLVTKSGGDAAQAAAKLADEFDQAAAAVNELVEGMVRRGGVSSYAASGTDTFRHVTKLVANDAARLPGDIDGVVRGLLVMAKQRGTAAKVGAGVPQGRMQVPEGATELMNAVRDRMARQKQAGGGFVFKHADGSFYSLADSKSAAALLKKITDGSSAPALTGAELRAIGEAVATGHPTAFEKRLVRAYRKNEAVRKASAEATVEAHKRLTASQEAVKRLFKSDRMRGVAEFDVRGSASKFEAVRTMRDGDLADAVQAVAKEAGVEPAKVLHLMRARAVDAQEQALKVLDRTERQAWDIRLAKYNNELERAHSRGAIYESYSTKFEPVDSMLPLNAEGTHKTFYDRVRSHFFSSSTEEHVDPMVVDLWSASVVRRRTARMEAGLTGKALDEVEAGMQVPTDVKSVELAFVDQFTEAVDEVGGRLYRTVAGVSDGSYLPFPQTRHGNRLIGKLRSGEALTDAELKLLREARESTKPSGLDLAIREADPGRAAVPHRKASEGFDSVADEFAALSKSKFTAAQVEEAAKDLAAKSKGEFLSEQTVDVLRDLVRRNKQRAELHGAERALAAMPAEERRLYDAFHQESSKWVRKFDAEANKHLDADAAKKFASDEHLLESLEANAHPNILKAAHSRLDEMRTALSRARAEAQAAAKKEGFLGSLFGGNKVEVSHTDHSWYGRQIEIARYHLDQAETYFKRHGSLKGFRASDMPNHERAPSYEVREMVAKRLQG